MDIQKAREKFAEINLKEGFYTKEELAITDLGVFEYTAAEQDWEKWWECLIYYVEPMLKELEAAKAQAVPAEFEIGRLKDQITELLDERQDLYAQINAQAVPEGFVLVRASDRDREVCELIDQRDNMERLADQLKDKLQDLYKVDFGEYTSCNCPLKNAIEYDDSNLVLVPREPTEEMLGAAWEAPPAGGPSGNRRVFYEKQAVVYKAMVEEAEKEMTQAQELTHESK